MPARVRSRTSFGTSCILVAVMFAAAAFGARAAVNALTGLSVRPELNTLNYPRRAKSESVAE